MILLNRNKYLKDYLETDDKKFILFMKTCSFESILTPKTFDLINMSQLGSNGVMNLTNQFPGELSRMLELKDLLVLNDNPNISQEIADFCQMVPIPLNQIFRIKNQSGDSKLVENTFARLKFQDGQTNAIASLQSQYAMFGLNEILSKFIGDSGGMIKDYFKDVELMEGP